jgi:hypothetical protein
VNLLAPLGLAALVAIPVILFLHMRHTTPPRRVVPSLRFWEAAQPRPSAERRFRRPPLTLPLVLQLIAAALLAVALARPATASQLAALAPGLHAEPSHLIILLDGSTSMSAVVSPDGQTRWDVAREAALERLARLREGDVATVILMATRPVTLTATDAASLVALRERLAAASLPGGRADLDGALTLAGDLLLPNLERKVVVLTDGAVSAQSAVVAGVGAPIELAVAGEAPAEALANLAITDIAARANPNGDGTIALHAAVANFGPSAIAAPVSLSGDGLEMGRGEVTFAGNGGVEALRWRLPPGMSELTVRIEQADVLPADNSATLLLADASTATIAPRILLVSDLPGALARALLAIENVQVTAESSDNLESAAASGYDLVVFDRSAPPTESLLKIDTPTLWVAPPLGGPFAASEQVSDPVATRIRAGDPLLDGVDLAGATFGPTPVFSLEAGDQEIVGSASGPLLYRTERNGQPAVVMAFDPETSNLPKRVAFPVLIANLVAALAPGGVPAAIPLGEPLVYEPRAAAAAVEVVSPSGEATSLPVAPLPAGEQAPASLAREVVFTDTGAAGAYTVTETDTWDVALGSTRFIVNAGHPRESDLRATPNLAATLADASGVGTTAPRQERLDLWPLVALLALAAIAVEWAAILWSGMRGTARPRARSGAT